VVHVDKAVQPVGIALKDIIAAPGYEAAQPEAGTAEIDVALTKAVTRERAVKPHLDSKEGVKQAFAKIITSKEARPADRVRALTEMGKIVGAYAFENATDLRRLSDDDLAALADEVIVPVMAQLQTSKFIHRRSAGG
jgi:hypothetical protein